MFGLRMMLVLLGFLLVFNNGLIINYGIGGEITSAGKTVTVTLPLANKTKTSVVCASWKGSTNADDSLVCYSYTLTTFVAKGTSSGANDGSWDLWPAYIVIGY